MEQDKYYKRYEQRYQTAYKAGAERWGFSPDDETLKAVLTEWVEENHLRGKKIIEFACGEGASGLILSKLGCIYHGVDIAPSALQKACELLKDFPQAKITEFDMVETRLDDTYDAALDVMGFHMLVTDADRHKYLTNMFNILKNNAPVLFFHECYREDIYDSFIDSVEQWIEITKIDCTTPERRSVAVGSGEVDIFIPLLPARPKNKEQYIKEMEEHSFIVDAFHVNGESKEIQYSANIYIHKP